MLGSGNVSGAEVIHLSSWLDDGAGQGRARKMSGRRRQAGSGSSGQPLRAPKGFFFDPGLNPRPGESARTTPSPTHPSTPNSPNPSLAARGRSGCCGASWVTIVIGLLCSARAQIYPPNFKELIRPHDGGEISLKFQEVSQPMAAGLLADTLRKVPAACLSLQGRR